MKKNVLLLMSFMNSLFVFGQDGQVGINTKEPTETLDVNGGMRVRNLPQGVSYPNTDTILMVDDSGVVYRSTPLDIVFSSGVYTSAISDNNWNNVRIGNQDFSGNLGNDKATKLEFVGNAAIGSGVNFTFSVYYDRRSAPFFTNLWNPITGGGQIISLSSVNNKSFNVTIDGEVFTFAFVGVSWSSTANYITNITCTNANGISVVGTFVTLSNFN